MKKCLENKENSWVPPDLCISQKNRSENMHNLIKFRGHEPHYPKRQTEVYNERIDVKADAMLANEKKLHAQMTNKMSDIEKYKRLLDASAAYAKNKSKSKSKSKSKGGRRSRRR